MADKDSRDGVRYGDKALIDWVDQAHAPHDAALDAAFASPDDDGMPAIMLGKSEARLLELLMQLAGAKRVVEIGALAGYSAIRLARGMADGGRLWTIEFDERYAEVVRRNVEQAGLSDRVEVVVGAALDVLPSLTQHGPFDAVFVDADKQNYAAYGAWARDNLRPGGLLIGDNAYLFGNLLEDSERAAAMRAFHEETAEHFESVCVPTPDGLVVGIRRE